MLLMSIWFLALNWRFWHDARQISVSKDNDPFNPAHFGRGSATSAALPVQLGALDGGPLRDLWIQSPFNSPLDGRWKHSQAKGILLDTRDVVGAE